MQCSALDGAQRRRPCAFTTGLKMCCCHTAQVLSFGGKRGMMRYMNSVEVMDCGSQVWSTPPVEGTGVAPCGR